MQKGIETKTTRMKAVWWIKKDFRIFDNECIHSALKDCGEVLPFFCWESKIINAGDYSKFHLQAQWQALEELRNNVEKRGGFLRVVSGEIVKEMDILFQQYSFTHLYSHMETGNIISYERDRDVAKWCKDRGVFWREISQSSVVRGNSAEGRRRKSMHVDPRKLSPIPAPKVIASPSSKSLRIENLEWRELCNLSSKFSGCSVSPSIQTVSEKKAWVTLNSFMDKRGVNYSGGISSPNKAFVHGSRLSTHLAWGTVSLRTVFAKLETKRKEISGQDGFGGWKRSLRGFESRLHWRDHFIQRLESCPDMEMRTLNPAFDNLEYEDRSDFLEAWVTGQTGYPMVDACMRCLRDTGFMNFRMRAMVVSFACFGLHLSWRFIHEPLAQLFTDYEPGIHISQLQMQAGVTGFNTLRVYSPMKQFMDQDPEAKFVKKWVPELADRTSVEIARASEMRFPEYCSALVSLSERSKDMKAKIFTIRKSQTAWSETQKTLKKHGSRKKTQRVKKQKDADQLRLPL